MVTTVEIVEGWTEALDWQLLADDAAVNLSGVTAVALIVHDKDAALVTLAGTASVLQASTGKVRYPPVAADFTAARAPYSVRWKVTDASGKIAYFPNGAPDILKVRA
jgi:hypothetical protein